MHFLRQHKSILKNFALTGLAVLAVAVGSIFQTKILKVHAAVQVLLVSRTAIAFGTVIPGENLQETYTVALDTSSNGATYVTTTSTIAGLLDLCPFLDIKSIDSPSEPDTLPNSILTRPGDILDKWQVSLNTPGIQGQVSQDHRGGIIVTGGDYGCKITIVTQDPTRIIIIKKAVGSDGAFSYSGDFGAFSLQTASGTASSTFSGLAPGRYQVTEATSTGWALQNLSCDDPSRDTTVNGATATINLASQETVTCTYINNKLLNGKIIVCKQSVGGADTFGFGGTLGGFDIKTQAGYFDQYCGGKKEDDSPSLAASFSSLLSGFGFGGNLAPFGFIPADGFGSKVFDNLTPGPYQVSESTSTAWNLSSLACADPTANTAISKNTASINLDSGETVVCTFVNSKKSGKGKISGTKYEDLDGQGTGPSPGDPTLQGWLIYLDLNNNGHQDAGEPHTVTDKHGNYSFDSLAPGNYTVREALVSGYKQIYPVSGSYQVTLSPGQEISGLDFGNFNTCKISGKVFDDKNGNGQQDSGESGLANQKIVLKASDGTSITTTTDLNGNFSFGSLGPGNFSVDELPQGGWVKKTGGSFGLILHSGQTVTGINFGNQK